MQMTESGTSWIKRIVVAADGSPASVRGLEQVADLAPRIGAKVTAIFVRHLATGTMMAPSMTSAASAEALDDQEAEVRSDVTRILGSTGAVWEFVVRAGSPGEEIVQLADETAADLVVVGSNRHSSLHNLVLGSTAAYLATHSRPPVLVMRPREASSTVEAPAEATGGMRS
jgi:nucleotide-binding universal stress UspA family protein